MDVFNLAASITLDTDEYERNLDNAGQKTSSFGDKLKSGLATAAKVGAAAITAVTAATTAMSAALVKGVSDTAAYGDNIDKMSQKMGMSAKAYQEWDAVMQHSGTSIESLQAGMKTLANAVESGNGAFERLGISQEQIASMNNEELFSATITALQNVENETERTYLAGQLLGRGATELGALLNTSAEDTQAMKDRVHELGGVMSDEAVKAAAAYQDSLQDMQTAFSGLSRGMTGDFLPSITTVMDGLAEIFSGNGEAGVEMVTQGLAAFMEKLQTAIPRVMEIGSQILGSLSSVIANNLPQILSAGTEIVTKLLMGIVSAIPKIATSAVDIITQLTTSISENFPTIMSSGMEAITAIINGISESLPQLVEAAASIITTLATDLASSLPDMIPTIVDIIITIVENLIDNVDQLVDAAIEIIMALADGLINALPTLLEKAPVIIQKLVTALANNLPKMMQAGRELILKLAKGIVENIPGLVKAIPQIITALVNGFKSFASNILGIGSNIVTGVWEGIKEKIGWFTDKVKNFFSNIVDGVKESLGIHSPSKVFASIGDNMALGLGEGWDEQFKSIKKRIDGDMDFDDPSISMSVAGTGSVSQAANDGGGLWQANGGITIPLTLELDGATLVSKTFRLFQGEASRIGPALVQI